MLERQTIDMTDELDKLVRIDDTILETESRRHPCPDPWMSTRTKSSLRKPLRSRWVIVGWVSLYSAMLLFFTFFYLSLMHRLESKQKADPGMDARPLLARTFHEVIPWPKN